VATYGVEMVAKCDALHQQEHHGETAMSLG
jgi:hypothetical protein